MRTATDPRHKRRIHAFKSLFAHTFIKQKTDSSIARQVADKQEKIDQLIAQCAPEWPVSQINKIDLSILRLAIWELLYRPQIPTKVIIDEAVEIAKRYGSQNSGSFVNGALAAAVKLTRKESKGKPKKRIK